MYSAAQYINAVVALAIIRAITAPTNPQPMIEKEARATASASDVIINLPTTDVLNTAIAARCSIPAAAARAPEKTKSGR